MELVRVKVPALRMPLSEEAVLSADGAVRHRQRGRGLAVDGAAAIDSGGSGECALRQCQETEPRLIGPPSSPVAELPVRVHWARFNWPEFRMAPPLV